MADGLCREDVTGLILAGGEGRRMGGLDKGWIDLDGRPLIAHVRDRLAPQVGQVMISANRHAERYAQWGDRVVADAPDLAGSLGPLAGIATALASATTPWVVTVACDMPWLPRDLVHRLGAAVGAPAPLAVARTDAGLQPVCMLLATTLAPTLHDYLIGGGRAVHRWLATVGAVEVVFPQHDAFANLNTPEDLAAAGTHGR